MGEVVPLNGQTKGDIPVETVLNGAKDCEYVLVLGYDKDGNLEAGCSTASLERAVFIASRFIHKVHAGDYGSEYGFSP